MGEDLNLKEVLQQCKVTMDGEVLGNLFAALVEFKANKKYVDKLFEDGIKKCESIHVNLDTSKEQLQDLKKKIQELSNNVAEKIFIYDIDFTEAILGYTAIYNYVKEEYENRIILDYNKMIEVMQKEENKLKLFEMDINSINDMYDFIDDIKTEYWFDDRFVIKYDNPPITE